MMHVSELHYTRGLTFETPFGMLTLHLSIGYFRTVNFGEIDNSRSSFYFALYAFRHLYSRRRSIDLSTHSWASFFAFFFNQHCRSFYWQRRTLFWRWFRRPGVNWKTVRILQVVNVWFCTLPTLLSRPFYFLGLSSALLLLELCKPAWCRRHFSSFPSPQ